MELRAGTSGFAYQEWKGAFYPEDLASRRMLAYYATQLGTVEINNTFYRMPKASVVTGWANQVPDAFRFVIKAPRQITHMRRLKDSAQPLTHFLGVVELLGAKEGALLFQLPPNFKADPARLGAFLALLPPGTRAAFEFRHTSWFDDAVYDLLRRHNAALCAAERDEEQTPFVSTADWGYLRLRRQAYRESDLHGWLDRIRAQGWRQVYCFFKHEDSAGGPLMARHFQTLATAPARQGRP